MRPIASIAPDTSGGPLPYRRITLGLETDTLGERRLVASNGDAVDPGRKGGYSRGEIGIREAIADIEAMYGQGDTWDLRWLKAANIQ